MNKAAFDKWVKENIIEGLLVNEDHVDIAEDGEVVIHTGMYRWADGSYHNQVERFSGGYERGYDSKCSGRSNY